VSLAILWVITQLQCKKEDDKQQQAGGVQSGCTQNRTREEGWGCLEVHICIPRSRTAGVGQDWFAILRVIAQMHAGRRMISSSKQAGFSQGVHRTAQGQRGGGVLNYISASAPSDDHPTACRKEESISIESSQGSASVHVILQYGVLRRSCWTCKCPYVVAKGALWVCHTAEKAGTAMKLWKQPVRMYRAGQSQQLQCILQ
jgi:hypothetical protein